MESATMQNTNQAEWWPLRPEKPYVMNTKHTESVEIIIYKSREEKEILIGVNRQACTEK